MVTKETILNIIEMMNKSINGYFEAIEYFINFKAWDIAAIFLKYILIDNFLQFYACAENLLKEKD